MNQSILSSSHTSALLTTLAAALALGVFYNNPPFFSSASGSVCRVRAVGHRTNDTEQLAVILLCRLVQSNVGFVCGPGPGSDRGLRRYPWLISGRPVRKAAVCRNGSVELIPAKGTGCGYQSVQLSPRRL
jgi:hypothetical protein